MSEQNQTTLKYEIGRIEDLLDRCSHSDAWIDGMIDIKLRNVKFEDAKVAIDRINSFMRLFSERRGFHNGVSYDMKFYVYRTEKTVICVGDYGSVDK